MTIQDMTLEERLAIIEQKSNNNKVKTKENETDLQIRTQEALSKVKDLVKTDNLKDIINNDEQILIAQGQINLLQNESVNQTAEMASNIGITGGGILSAITGSNI